MVFLRVLNFALFTIPKRVRKSKHAGLLEKYLISHRKVGRNPDMVFLKVLNFALFTILKRLRK
ncbi:hypothetical protein DYD21_05310 [Rhodohalobacter sp. SW132]|nr:hypothetical protein DYD21_05310 [Rhodohalobacter sp. SW132]